MAEQTGLIKIRGKLGDQIFYAANGKDLVKNAASKPHKLSEGTKKTAAEFAQLTKVASLINAVLKQYFGEYRDSKLYFRLYKFLPKVTGALSKIKKGERKFATGKLSTLKNFQLNATTPIDRLFRVEPFIAIMPEKQQVEISIPEFTNTALNVPKNTAQVIIAFIVYAIDFDANTYEVIQTDELTLLVKEEKHGSCKVTLAINMENRVVIVGIGLKLSLKSDEGSYISGNKHYFAGSLKELAYVKNGIIVPFVEQERTLEPQEQQTQVRKAMWCKH